MGQGKFVISLDFELMWGVRDILTAKDYGDNILGVHETFGQVLELFKTYKIKATYATVGFIFAKNKTILNQFIPALKPKYSNGNLSPYLNYIKNIGDSELDDRYNYGYSMLRSLEQNSNIEVASHTFSHYYCLEAGQTLEEFDADISAAVKIAKMNAYDLKSIVFPRNQYNQAYIETCTKHGIIAFRGNEKSWIYRAVGSSDKIKFLRRLFRFIDRYINLSGHNCSDIKYISAQIPYNIPSSRFLSPFNSRLRTFEKIRVKRILNSMTYAAENDKVFHLWWHPHNFGIKQEKNLQILEKILMHYKMLNTVYDFESHSMLSLAEQIKSLAHEP